MKIVAVHSLRLPVKNQPNRVQEIDRPFGPVVGFANRQERPVFWVRTTDEIQRVKSKFMIVRNDESFPEGNWLHYGSAPFQFGQDYHLLLETKEPLNADVEDEQGDERREPTEEEQAALIKERREKSYAHARAVAAEKRAQKGATE